MSLAPFAALQQRINSAVLTYLPNAVAVVDGREVAVLFDKPYADPFGGQIDAAAPVLQGDSAALAGVQRDSTITVDGQAYRVMTAQPDGTGLTLLTLGGA